MTPLIFRGVRLGLLAVGVAATVCPAALAAGSGAHSGGPGDCPPDTVCLHGRDGAPGTSGNTADGHSSAGIGQPGEPGLIIHLSGTGGAVHPPLRPARDRLARERARSASQRDRSASQRERLASQREWSASQREREASLRAARARALRAAQERAALERAALERAALERAALERAALERAALERAIWQRHWIQAQQRAAAGRCWANACRG